jgi:hypothetical protein
MLSRSEETPFPDSDPFEYGDQTVVQLRAQPFIVEDELGTIVTMPIDTHTRLIPVPRPEEVFVEEDPLARMERKLDAAMRQIAALQQQLDSLDLTLARVLAR